MVAATVPVGAQALSAMVTRLRQSLAPSVAVLGDLPPFDLTTAHEVYRTLLAPVTAGWKSAGNVLIVANGPLGQLPFTLLPVEAAALGPEHGALFSNYRDVAWLIRSHTVTVLPTATSLVTLRALPPGDVGRRPFVGFGDPVFNEAQALAMATGKSIIVAQATDPDLAARTPMPLRGLIESPAPNVAGSELAQLPRLPDTANEIREIAAATGADPSRDVFLGLAANEQTVKTHDLARYRVIAFATHGLVPGDLTGLTEPALALSSPSVAQVDGDGLLTLEEVLGLRLNADWVVLSACNTASGNGNGSEALSGLGRAFFYAGTRSLLVSNWPVETTSARVLTTDLFRRQQSNPRLSRAQALQQTLVTLIDEGGLVDSRTGRVLFSYAHPIFWAPFSLVGDGG
jgi:CHAT domain-containing protein